MSTLVLCLVVVGAAFVVVNRQIEGPQTATHTAPADRDPPEESNEMPVDAPTEARRPRHLARDVEPLTELPVEPEPADRAWPEGAETVPLDGRDRPVRAGLLLGLLLVGLGAGAALALGFLLVALVTALRTAIG